MLDEVAQTAKYSEGLNGEMIRYSTEIFLRWATPGSTLEIGPAEGHATDLLLVGGRDLEVLEGSQKFAIQLRRKFPNLTIHNCLIEDFTPDVSYNNIILSHVLEHVADPASAIARIALWLAPGGILFAAVPNALSFHRQLGVLAGDLCSEDSLNSSDRSIGHRRVYDGKSLRQLIAGAGLDIQYFGGYFLKALSNSQLEAVTEPRYVRSLMAIGERIPEYAADIYVVASKH